MSTVEVRVPDMGNFESVTVIDVLVKPGDTIDIDTPLVTLETDKATMDVPSTAKGVVEKVHVTKGGSVSTGCVDRDREGGRESQPRQRRRAQGCSVLRLLRRLPPRKPRLRRAAAAAPSSIDVSVPDMGSFDSVGVIDVLVKAGDTVDFDTPLVTLETDKATMDVPSTAKGVVEKVHVAKGGKVSPGSVVVTVKGHAAAAAPRPPNPRRLRRLTNPPAQAARPAAPQGVQQVLAPAARGGLPPIDEASFGAAHASPSVRKFARELGVNLGSVRGSGEKGRILLDDVKAFVKMVMAGGGPVAAAPALPKAHNYDPSAFGAGRGQAAQSRAEDLRSAPAGRVDQHPACHAVRRIRHHGSRSAARFAEGKGRGCGREGHAAGVHHRGGGARDARIPGAQQPAG